MKAKPMLLTITDGKHNYAPCEAADATHVQLEVPGPFQTRLLPVRCPSKPNWNWNGDTERPTLTPSILTTLPLPNKTIVCHSYVTDGKIQFLGDCTHEFAGQTVDLLDVE